MKKLMTMAMAILTTVQLAAVRPAAVAQDSWDPIRDTVRRLELGKAVSHGGLTIIPVYLERVLDRTGYATLEDALKNGWITITEVEGGRVPQVKISNLSKHLVFLMGGEILTGCRQDRILAGDVLLAPGTKDLLAPVYCVEQGRWSPYPNLSKQNLGLRRSGPGPRRNRRSGEIWADRRKQAGDLSIGSLPGRLCEGGEPRPDLEDRGKKGRPSPPARRYGGCRHRSRRCRRQHGHLRQPGPLSQAVAEDPEVLGAHIARKHPRSLARQGPGGRVFAVFLGPAVPDPADRLGVDPHDSEANVHSPTTTG
jgi:hypothetical protein